MSPRCTCWWAGDDLGTTSGRDPARPVVADPVVLMSVGLAAALAAASAGCLVGLPRQSSLRLTGLDVRGAASGRPTAAWGRRGGRPAGVGALVAVVLVLVLVLAGPAATLLAVLGPLAVRRTVATRRRAGDRGLERRRAVEACAALAGELRAGRPPAVALAVAADLACGPSRELLRAAGSAAQLGGDVAGALSSPGGLAASAGVDIVSRVGGVWRSTDAGAAAGGPASAAAASAFSQTAVPEVLRALAACWTVCSTTGSGLASAVDRLEEGLRADQERRRAVEAELAGPRATAGMLAVLPVAGLLLATGLGAHPVNLLLHTPLGLACLTGGVLLDGVGLVWTARLVARAGGSA